MGEVVKAAERKLLKLELAERILDCNPIPIPPKLTAEMIAYAHSLPELRKELARLQV